MQNYFISRNEKIRTKNLTNCSNTKKKKRNFFFFFSIYFSLSTDIMMFVIKKLCAVENRYEIKQHLHRAHKTLHRDRTFVLQLMARPPSHVHFIRFYDICSDTNHLRNIRNNIQQQQRNQVKITTTDVLCTSFWDIVSVDCANGKNRILYYCTICCFFFLLSGCGY